MNYSKITLTNNKRTGGNYFLPSSILPHKKSKTVKKTASIYFKNLDLPLISTATGSSLDSIILEPDRAYTIGRTNRSCDFTFNNRLVSKQHCQILFDSNNRKIYIFDGAIKSRGFSVDFVVNEFRRRLVDFDYNELEEEEEKEIEECLNFRVSSNGVFVNGVRVKKGRVRELFAGDEVLLVCGNEGLCRFRSRIGFFIQGIVFKEGVVFGLNEDWLERPRFVGGMTGMTSSGGHSQGTTSSGNRKKRVFACPVDDDILPVDGDFSRLKCDDVIGRVNFLLSQCRDILGSDDPITYIRRGIEGTYCCSNRVNKFPCLTGKFSIGSEPQVKSVVPVSRQQSLPCDRRARKVRSCSPTVNCEKVVALDINRDHLDVCAHGNHLHQKDFNMGGESQVKSVVPVNTENVVALDINCDHVDVCAHGNHLHQNDSVEVSPVNGIANNDPKASILNSISKENAPHIGGSIQNTMEGNSCLPPGKKFHLNRLEFMDHRSLGHHTDISLPELLYPVESILRIFIATFTSDLLWFLSYCEIPRHLPVTVACHNTERCWSSSPDKRTSIPYPDFPNLIVVYPPFPEAIAFGKDRKKQGIACHHPKVFVVQREDRIRVIITSANLGAKQWNSVTNTVWWQDFPRRSVPDYSSLFVQIPEGEINQDSRSDFAAQLAGFVASLLIDVPCQAHWIVELTKYDFDGAVAHLIASVPGIHSYRSPYVSANQCASWSYGEKFFGSVEASVVGLSHLFHNAADSNGAQLKRLAAFLGKSRQNSYGMSEIVLRRNCNVPADANAVSIVIPNPDAFSEGDCIQLGFLPRNIAKWVSPLWDIGFFKFFGFVCPQEALAAALGESNKKVQLILHVSQGPHFPDISKMMQPEHVIALCSLIASIQRCTGLWRLQEVLGQYKWPEPQESEFIYGSSSIGSSVSAQFLAAFSAAAGKRSLRFCESEESDPEWGCWSASQELKSPSIRIIFPTIERVKNACDGILPSKRMLCFSEKTWQRLITVDILHDAIPYPHDRIGHPMHVKVARRRFQSRTDSCSFGWVYCGSHNFSAAAWGRPISNSSGTKASEPEKNSSGLRLHICNYELGIIFIFPPTETGGSTNKNTTNLDDVVLPFVVPAPKYGPRDRPATAQAMREALAELTEPERERLVELATIDEMMEEIPDEEEDVLEVTDYVAEEKEEEKAYAEILWSQVDSSQSC